MSKWIHWILVFGGIYLFIGLLGTLFYGIIGTTTGVYNFNWQYIWKWPLVVLGEDN